MVKIMHTCIQLVSCGVFLGKDLQLWAHTTTAWMTTGWVWQGEKLPCKQQQQNSTK